MTARYIETMDGFGIVFEAEPEDISMRDHFIRECGWTESQFRKIRDFKWFRARVSAWKNGVELASEYLGACCYKTVKEFYTTYHDEYFAQMARECVEQAKIIEHTQKANCPHT
jgi:hypothetical protein